MALALNPDVVVMDEPTTALDVLVQREILGEIDRLRELFGFAVVFITHDLSLLLEISHRIAIMYAGRVVELATAAELRDGPRHPYTAALLSSFPSLRGERRELRGIPGSPPDLSLPETGCAFAPRCPRAAEVCLEAVPPLVDGVACVRLGVLDDHA
jgi:peptide/nickel transport system ATP-binding protein